jgi:hypothetical protein
MWIVCTVPTDCYYLIYCVYFCLWIVFFVLFPLIRILCIADKFFLCGYFVLFHITGILYLTDLICLWIVIFGTVPSNKYILCFIVLPPPPPTGILCFNYVVLPMSIFVMFPKTKKEWSRYLVLLYTFMC